MSLKLCDECRWEKIDKDGVFCIHPKQPTNPVNGTKAIFHCETLRGQSFIDMFGSAFESCGYVGQWWEAKD